MTTRRGEGAAGIGAYRGIQNQVLSNRCWGNPAGIVLDYGADQTVVRGNDCWDATAGPACNLLVGSGATNTVRSGNRVGAD